MRRLPLVLLLAVFSLGVQSAHALPLPQKIKSWPAWSNAFAPEIAPSVAGQVDFGAIVALDNCSGSLVRFETSIGTDQAMVLTNGHCLGGGFLPAGTAVSNKPATRSFRLLSRDGKTTLGRLNATRIIYGTMTGTDMALYGLRETFDEIEKKFGTTALTMSSARPKDGRKIAVASGYWKKIYSCSIDRFIFELRESNWTWNDSIRYTQPGCETIGGTSGSPVIDAETREVVGVNNTGNEDGENCTMNNPCEVDANGNTSVHHKASYGQQTFWIYGCLGQGNELQLERPGCKLTK